MNKLVRYVVPALMIAAFIVAIAWAICAPDFEPAITALALLSSLAAIFTDRWINQRERRKELLKALAHELYMNIGVLSDLNLVKNKEHIDKPHIYPRFYNTSLASIIASGLFAGEKDKKLWKCMNGWLQKSSDFNNRLNITEFQVFSNSTDASIFNKEITAGKFSLMAINELKALIDILMTKYNVESSIDYDTVLFDEEKA